MSRSSDKDIPALLSQDRAPDAVWVRLSAFLSTRAKNTQETYLGVLKEWCAFLGVEPGTPAASRKLLAASDLHAIAYRAWLKRQPGMRPRMRRSESASKALATEVRRAEKRDGLQATQSNATIWKKFAALRRMYRVLIAANLGLAENPFDRDRVPPPSKESGRKRPTEMLDFEVVREVLELPDARTPKGLRDAAILATLFGGGLRRSEAAGIRVGDVKRSASGTAYVYLRATKARKDAAQALPAWAAKPVLALCAARKREGASDADYLFVSYRGRGGASPAPGAPVSHSGIYRLFKQYCMRAGARGHVSPHSARATAITKLLSDGVPHRLVQEFSRHSSVQMVEVYDKRRIGVDENPAVGLDYKTGKHRRARSRG